MGNPDGLRARASNSSHPDECTTCGYPLSPQTSNCELRTCTECGIVELDPRERAQQLRVVSVGLSLLILGIPLCGAGYFLGSRYEQWLSNLPLVVPQLLLAIGTAFCAGGLAPRPIRRRVRGIAMLAAISLCLSLSPNVPGANWANPMPPVLRIDWIGFAVEWGNRVMVPAMFGSALYSTSQIARRLGMPAMGVISGRGAVFLAALLFAAFLCAEYFEPFLNRIETARINALPRGQQFLVSRPLTSLGAIEILLHWMHQLVAIGTGVWLWCVALSTRARASGAIAADSS